MMKSKILMVLTLTVVLVLLVSVSALAMASANYQLNWFTPLSGNGGGPSSSASYAVNTTIGQTITGLSSGTNFKTRTGYWAGNDAPYSIFLPLLNK